MQRRSLAPRAPLALAALLVAGLLTAAGPPAAAAGADPAPLLEAADPVPGEYIVTLDDDTEPDTLLSEAAAPDIDPLYTYTSVLNGFAAQLTADELDAVRAMPGVASVEENGTVSVAPVAPVAPVEAERAAASWGLDRIDQRFLPLDGQFTTHHTGAGVTAYVIDTGIDYAHPEFAGRAVPGFDAIGDRRNGADCAGHGTHVAGTVGGESFGVAPDVRLVSVRVLDCDGFGDWAGIIAGFDWVARNATQPAVANASLGGAFSQAVNDAATNLAAAGVLPVVAAGNAAADACEVSPASAGGVLTVGATDRADRQASFSNFGPCLEIYAPGVDIVSARIGGGSQSLDGTSMASPHVAGVAALLKQEIPTAGPGTLAGWILDIATQGVLTVSPDSPDRLLFTGGW